MLDFRRMQYVTFSPVRLIGIAFLLIISTPVSRASTLHDEAVDYRMKGFEAQKRGDVDAALGSYQKAAALDPTYATPLNDAGILLEEKGQLEDAEKSYQRALLINPQYPEAHANLGMLYERMGNKEKAIYHWMKRYQLGEAADLWTARAEERLVALGVLEHYPGLKGQIYTRRSVMAEEFKAHAQSVEDYRTVTEQHGYEP